MQSYLVVGGGLAAARACRGIRSLDTDSPITLFTDEPHWPYERPPLSKEFLAGKSPASKMTSLSEKWATRHNVTVRRNTTVTAVDTRARRVTLSDGSEAPYTRLLLATGGRAIRLPIPGADLEGVFTLRTVENSEAIRAAAGSGKRALVIGGSFVGSEVAASLSQLGCTVTVAFLESHLLARVVPAAFSAYLAQRYAEAGVTLWPETGVTRLLGDGHVQRAELSSGEVVDADLVVMGVGMRVNTGLAREAGLALTEQGAVVVDPFLRTSDPVVYAAGDIAAWPDPNFGRQLRVEHWDVAYRQGYQAGRNMAGAGERYGVMPYFFSDLFELTFDAWGNLDRWDQTVLRGAPDSGACAVFYFDRQRLVGALTMGRPDDERDPVQALVARQPTYEDIASALADESGPLSELV